MLWLQGVLFLVLLVKNVFASCVLMQFYTIGSLSLTLSLLQKPYTLKKLFINFFLEREGGGRGGGSGGGEGGERQREREKHRFLVPSTYAFIG